MKRTLRKVGCASAATMELVSGEPSGDQTETTLRLSEGQWGSSKVKQTDDGLEITFFGEFERQELLDFMTRARLDGDFWIYGEDDI